MIVTVLQSFVDAPKGRNATRYTAGDVVSMAVADFERITGQNKNLLYEGKKDLGIGTCHACSRNNKRKQQK